MGTLLITFDNDGCTIPIVLEGEKCHWKIWQCKCEPESPKLPVDKIVRNAQMINSTIGEMSDLYKRYKIKEFNEETGKFELAHTHNMLTQNLCKIISYYEKHL